MTGLERVSTATESFEGICSALFSTNELVFDLLDRVFCALTHHIPVQRIILGQCPAASFLPGPSADQRRISQDADQPRHHAQYIYTKLGLRCQVGEHPAGQSLELINERPERPVV